MSSTKTTEKRYPYIIIPAPGYTDNKAPVRSRHMTLTAAKRRVGKGECIVERETSKATAFVFWSGIRDAKYPIH